ncbi:hypothetical protein V7114_15370 [Neobacillus niacini]|uniref:hypothetical protein n=1 Tax=Neobacillus niacini TaxID=86668 RepID=UPI002FFDCD23
MLIGIAVLYVAIIIATIVVIFTRRVKGKQPGEILRVKEINITSLLGIFLLLEAGAILYYGLTTPERLITSSRAETNVYIFLLLSIGSGAFMQLYYFVKCCIITKDGVTGVSIWGRQTTLSWNEIASSHLTNGKRLTLTNKDGSKKFTVGGEKGTYKEFVKLASKNIRPEAGDDVLRNLKVSLKI